MQWNKIETIQDLEQADTQSFQTPVLIFKHSTTCSISDIANRRLKSLPSSITDESVSLYYIDLLQFKPISNSIAEKYKVYHESPQVLLIHTGECFYDSSHMDIQWSEITEQLQGLFAEATK